MESFYGVRAPCDGGRPRRERGRGSRGPACEVCQRPAADLAERRSQTEARLEEGRGGGSPVRGQVGGRQQQEGAEKRPVQLEPLPRSEGGGWRGAGLRCQVPHKQWGPLEGLAAGKGQRLISGF